MSKPRIRGNPDKSCRKPGQLARPVAVVPGVSYPMGRPITCSKARLPTSLPKSRAGQAEELIDAIDALVAYVKSHERGTLPYAQVCGEMHPLGMKVQERACALDLASSEKPVYCDFLKAPDDAAIAIAQRGRIQVRVLDLHNTWPGWVLYDLVPGAANSEPYFNFSMRLLVEGFPWYEKMAVLRRKADMILAESAQGASDDGAPFYKPSYFQQWNISGELLRRNATSSRKYEEGRVRRIKKAPASGKGKRAVHWYSDPDTRKCWPDRFKAAEDEQARKASMPSPV